MNKDTIIISNNPKVKEFFKNERAEVIYVEGSYEDVLYAVRDRVQLSYHLLTHPLSGSIKPNETPYKSIAIKKEKELDLLSLELISNAIEVYKKLKNSAMDREYIARLYGYRPGSYKKCFDIKMLVNRI